MGSPCWTPLEQRSFWSSRNPSKKTRQLVLYYSSCTIELGHQQRERWHAVGDLRKHRHPFHSVKGVGAVSDKEPVACLMQRLCPQSHMLYCCGYGEPQLPHLSVDLLQPGPPLSHGPSGNEPPPCHAHANRPTLFAKRTEDQLREELPELWRNTSGSSTILRQKVVPRPNSSRPISLWVIGWRCANR